jgi:hypothetical protein
MLTPQGKAQHWTPHAIARALRQFVKTHKRLPTSREWHSGHGLPSHDTLERYEVTVVELLRMPPERRRGPYHTHPDQRHWAPGAQIAAVRRWQQRHGTWPVTRDFDQDIHLPKRPTVRRAFGTLAELRRRAGMPGGGHEGHGGGGRRGGPSCVGP